MLQNVRHALNRWLLSSSKALNYDFCPWANRWVYWLKNPLWCLVLTFAASIACGLMLNAAVFIVSGALAVVLGLGIAWPWLTMSGIHCGVEFDRTRVREGEPVHATITVTNRWPWPAWGLSLVRGFVPDVNTTGGGASFSRVAGWDTAKFMWRFVPECRGIYPIAPPELECGFPFGLFTARSKVDVAAALIVWPRTVALNAMPDAAESHPLQERLNDRRPGDFGDSVGTRPFRSGDSLRRVHWAQTARNCGLVVCEKEAPETSALRVFVDIDRNSHQPGDGQTLDADRDRTIAESINACIRVAASVCESMHRQHAWVECSIGTRRFQLGSSLADLRRVMDAFASVPVDGICTDSSEPSSDGRDLFRIHITTDQALQRGLVHVASGAGGGLVVVNTCGRVKSSGFEYRPWLEVSGDEGLDPRFPQLWRRACHVA